MCKTLGDQCDSICLNNQEIQSYGNVSVSMMILCKIYVFLICRF